MRTLWLVEAESSRRREWRIEAMAASAADARDANGNERFELAVGTGQKNESGQVRATVKKKNRSARVLTEGEEHSSRSSRPRSCRAQDGQQTPDDPDRRRDSFSDLFPDKGILGRFERVRGGGRRGGEREAVDDAGEGEGVRGSREGVA